MLKKVIYLLAGLFIILTISGCSGKAPAPYVAKNKVSAEELTHSEAQELLNIAVKKRILKYQKEHNTKSVFADEKSRIARDTVSPDGKERNRYRYRFKLSGNYTILGRDESRCPGGCVWFHERMADTFGGGFELVNQYRVFVNQVSSEINDLFKKEYDEYKNNPMHPLRVKKTNQFHKEVLDSIERQHNEKMKNEEFMEQMKGL